MDTTFLSMVGFAVAMYITPGPNNAMLAASAASFGLRATVPHMLGVACGFSFMLVVVTAGLGAALLVWPPLLPLMRWVGVAWLLLLAWKIGTAIPQAQAASGSRRVLGFAGAVAFQWVNPKGWLIALAAAGMFARPDQPAWLEAAWIGTVFLIVSLPCMAPWMFLGAGAGRLLHSSGRVRWFNIAMALLLVVSVIPVLLD